MKTHNCLSRLAPVLLALALLVVPAALRAEDAPEKKLTKNQEKYDADKDGKLSDEEKAAAKAAAREKAKETKEANLEKYDTNRNGKLDESERVQKKSDEDTARAEHKAEREAKKVAKDAEKK